MQRKTLLAWLVACAVGIAACSGTPQTLLSPSAVSPTTAFANPDGSTIKVTAPSGLNPDGGTINTTRPVLAFVNPVGRFIQIGYAYDIEVQNANGTIVYSRIAGESPGSSSHAMEIDLPRSDNYFWRVRARLGQDVGPWSSFATFRTPDPVGPPPPLPGAGLPFAIPGSCGPGDPGNRIACAAAMASLSSEWSACAGGRGVACHRFTRQVAYALSQSDPDWKLIVASPGGHACDCLGCGPSDGTMFREDTVVYRGNRVFDMIVGAGGPSPSLNWSEVPGPRSGDRPSDAPLCPR
jgi:hypothetical protein